jgi:hypothetical protein
MFDLMNVSFNIFIPNATGFLVMLIVALGMLAVAGTLEKQEPIAPDELDMVATKRPLEFWEPLSMGVEIKEAGRAN